MANFSLSLHVKPELKLPLNGEEGGILLKRTVHASLRAFRKQSSENTRADWLKVGFLFNTE